MNIIIAGTRTYDDDCWFNEWLDKLFAQEKWLEQPRPLIISGGAPGADSLALEYAENHGIPHLEFYPNWDMHGRAAGPIRNRLMAQYGDVLIAFWDHASKGTKSMIDEAQRLKIPVYICSTNVRKHTNEL